jgi:hypothetical protein
MKNETEQLQIQSSKTKQKKIFLTCINQFRKVDYTTTTIPPEEKLKNKT